MFYPQTFGLLGQATGTIVWTSVATCTRERLDFWAVVIATSCPGEETTGAIWCARESDETTGILLQRPTVNTLEN